MVLSKSSIGQCDYSTIDQSILDGSIGDLFDNFRCFFYHNHSILCRTIPIHGIDFRFIIGRKSTEYLQKFVNWLELTGSNKKRFSESLWKCIFYTSTWSYCLYLIKYRYDYFDQPYLIWDGKLNLEIRSSFFVYSSLDWSVNLIIPLDIKFIYIIECGFYFHSIYATLYMDHRRKDFYIMIVHHVLTIMLIFFSYGMR